MPEDFGSEGFVGLVDNRPEDFDLNDCCDRVELPATSQSYGADYIQKAFLYVNELLKKHDPILLLPGVNAQALRAPMADLNMPQFQNPIINNGFGGGFGNIANDNFARAPAPQASARQNNFGAGNFYAESLVRQGDQAHMWTDHRPQYSGGVAHDPYHVKQQSHIFKDPYADLFKSVDHKPLFKSEYPDPIKPPKTNFGNDHSYSQFNSWHTPNLKPRFDSPSSFSSFSSSSFSESSNLASRINLANSESSLKTLEWDLKELKSKYPKQSFWNLENDMALKKSQLCMQSVFDDHAQFGNPNNFQWDFKHENKEQKAEDFQNFEGVGATMGDYKIPNYNSAEYQKRYQRNSESGREESEPLPRKSAAGAGGGKGGGGDDGDGGDEGWFKFRKLPPNVQEKYMDIISSMNPVKIMELFIGLGSHSFDVSLETLKNILNKVPREFRASASFVRTGVGIRWGTKDSSDNIRVMKGEHSAKHEAQRNHYVKITSDGKTIGRRGIAIESTRPHMDTEAHIPLEEWLKWRE